MGNYIVNETNREVVVSRTKMYKIPANSIVTVDLLCEALGTDLNDIELSLEKQYPRLKLLDALYVVSKIEKSYRDATPEYVDDEKLDLEYAHSPPS